MADSLKDLQMRLLNMQKDIASFCEEEKIPYFLIGGSLLGAIRHNGFIPWDDDLDIGMTRKNYEKFLEKFPKSSLEKKGYFLKIPGSTPDYHATFTKVCDPYTLLEENTNQPVNLFIDIFPFDFAPEKVLLAKIQNAMYLFWFQSVKFRMRDITYTGRKKVLYGLISGLTKPFSLQTMINKRDKWLRKYENAKNARLVVNFSSSYGYHKEQFMIEELDELELHKFEDTQFLIPKNYHAFLERMYGDYLQLPPLSQQQPKHILRIISLEKTREGDENK